MVGAVVSSPRATWLTAIAACLQRIKKADGYNTDAGLTVTLEPHPVLGEGAAAEVGVIWTRQERPQQDAVRRTHRLTTARIVAYLPASYAARQDVLDDVVTDIEAALADQQFRFPPSYEFPKYQSAEPVVSAPADGWVAAVITVTGHIPIR